jgi:restriction system protein
MPEHKVWGIHAGRTGDAESLFFRDSCVALGWPQLGDLSKLPADREAFKRAVAKAFPNAKPGVIPNNAGQLFRFVHELKAGDLVVYPSKATRQVHLGTVGSYKHKSSETEYPNTRSVQWIRALPRTSFSQGALYEIGSALSFFQVRNHADEFNKAAEGKAVAPAPSEDESVALVAENIEETTRDFVLKELATELKGHPFAEFVAHLLTAMGFHTRLSPEGPDGGIDIIAHRDELGFEPPIIKVQVKSGAGSVGDPVASALYGKVTGAEFGLLITLGTFTAQALSFARSKSNLRLIDGDELVELVLRHYDSLDAKYKALLPLKRVYVPQQLEEEEAGA